METDAPAPGIIFDLDGTLIDSLADLTSAVNHACAALGRPEHSPAAVQGMVGDGMAKLVARAVGDANETAHAEALVMFRDCYAAHCLDQTRPYPGVPEMLAHLAAAGCPLAVLSNKPNEFTRRCVSALLGEIPFVDVVGDRPHMPRKPDPQAARVLAAAMSRTCSQVVLIGDSCGDVETAHAARMASVAVTWGYRGAEVLRAAAPSALVDAPEQITLEFCRGLWAQSRGI